MLTLTIANLVGFGNPHPLQRIVAVTGDERWFSVNEF